MERNSIVTVFGGSGFLGRYVVQALARAGYRVQVICRDAEAAASLKPLGNVGQIAIVSGDITKPESWQHRIGGCRAVINLVGLLYQSGGGQKFTKVHAKAVGKLAEVARETGVEKFVHVSALGVDRAIFSSYARSKIQGETNARTIFPGAVILRPGVMFGPEDNFFNQFARMAAYSPFLPLIGGGKTKFQPVYAVDVARAIVKAVEDDSLAGKTYALAGPDVFTFREIMQLILNVTGQKARLVSIPFPLASLLGAFASLLPKPPLTRDQVTLIKTDNMLDGELPGFEAFGISPASAMDVVPTYLKHYHLTTADEALSNG